MDSKRVTRPRETRRRHSEEFRQALVRRSLVPGASVAAIAQEAGVNANLLFNWRRLHLQAQAPSVVGLPAPALLPVTIVEATPAAAPSPVPPPAPRSAPASTIEIDINGARVRVRGPRRRGQPARRAANPGQRPMIGLPAGTRVWIVAGHTDMRKGFDGLAALVQTALAENPFKGHVFVFRGRRGDIIKVLWFSPQDIGLFA